MAAKKTARTGAAPFAHLLSIVTGTSAASRRAEEERDEEEAAAEEDETDAEEEDHDEKAEDGRPDEDAEADDDEEKAEDEDDETDAEDEEDEKKARATGFAEAQARGRKIFGAASAALRPDMAAHLAFNETMPAAKAIAMLDLAAAGGAPKPAASGSRLHRRMSKVVLPKPGTGGTNGRRTGGSDVDAFVAAAKSAAEKAGI